MRSQDQPDSFSRSRRSCWRFAAVGSLGVMLESVFNAGKLELVAAVFACDFVAFQLVPCVREDRLSDGVFAIVLRA